MAPELSHSVTTLQVLHAADGGAAQAHRAAERGEVRLGKLDDVERVAVRPEVVHLGAVGGIVVDHDQHAQAQPRDGLEVRQAQ